MFPIIKPSCSLPSPGRISPFESPLLFSPIKKQKPRTNEHQSTFDRFQHPHYQAQQQLQLPQQQQQLDNDMLVLSNYECIESMPTSCIDEITGMTSPTPQSPLRRSLLLTGHHQHFSVCTPRSAIKQTAIRTPITLITKSARVQKSLQEYRKMPSAERVLQQRSLFAMPRLADSILDMRICSSPAPVVDPQSSNDMEDGGGEVLRLPHFQSVKDAIKRISPATVVDLLDGRYRGCYDDLMVVDCRYPYEFAGGHIPGAVNVNSPEGIDKLLLENPPEPGKHVCLVFHCEFSSQRAPRMALHVRNFDRLLNADRYPKLFYPEVYILDGGYKSFFDSFSDRCEPPGHYVPMKNANNRDDLRHQQRLRQSFRSHWAHSHINKRPAKFFRKCASLTIDPARSFFKQLSENSQSIQQPFMDDLGEDGYGVDEKMIIDLDSVNEFELSGSGLQDLPSSVY